MSTQRKAAKDAKKRDIINLTCDGGHKETYPDKGLGRAMAAAWESKHKTCVKKAIK